MLAVAYMSSLENATVSLKEIYTQHFLAGSKLSGECGTSGSNIWEEVTINK
jgi:hypothetical protein